MSIGPEDLDLTDDNGRLRPEVARALQDVPDRPLPQLREADRPAGPPQGPVPAAPGTPAATPRLRQAALRNVPDQPRGGLPVREIRLAVPDLGAVRVPLPTFVVILALTSIAAGYAGSHFGRLRLGDAATKVGAAAFSQGTAGPAGSSIRARVSGFNVNLRTGPGVSYPVATRLQDGEPIAIREERMGWYSASTNSATTGWVFGAYLSGVAGADRSPAIVRRMIVSGVGPGLVVLRPGQRVLHVRTPDGRSAALLPDGLQVGVEDGGLVDVR